MNPRLVTWVVFRLIKFIFFCILVFIVYSGLYGVGKAAENSPALVVLSHTPMSATRTIAWVGKGIVYDTGGLCIKAKVCFLIQFLLIFSLNHSLWEISVHSVNMYAQIVHYKLGGMCKQGAWPPYSLKVRGSGCIFLKPCANTECACPCDNIQDLPLLSWLSHLSAGHLITWLLNEHLWKGYLTLLFILLFCKFLTIVSFKLKAYYNCQ